MQWVLKLHVRKSLIKKMFNAFRKDLFPCLLNNIFRLMPVEVLQDNKNKAAKLVEMFSTIPSLNFAGMSIYNLLSIIVN